ncbi:MAG: hypothetical protein AAFY28_14675 [Actinomycetota bacterium]
MHTTTNTHRNTNNNQNQSNTFDTNKGASMSNNNTATITSRTSPHARATRRSGRTRKIGTAAMIVAALLGAGSSVMPSTTFAAEPATSAATAQAAVIEPLTTEELQEFSAAADALLAELGADAGFQAAPSFWESIVTSIGSKLGEKVFGKVVEFGLDALLDELGLGDGTSQALKNIESAISGVQKSVDENTELLKSVLVKSSWDKFELAESDVQAAAGLVSKTTKSIAGFEDKMAAGLIESPSASDIDDMWDWTTGAITTLEGKIAGGAGTMAFLQEAVTSQNPEQGWKILEQYRGHYRNVMAQALVNLAWLVEYDDLTDKTLVVFHDVAVDSAEDTVAAMYEGVGAIYQNPVAFNQQRDRPFGNAPQRSAGTTVHLTNNRPGTMYASGNRPVAVGETTSPVRTGDAARTMYNRLRAEFEAGKKNGRNFEEHLEWLGIPTTVVHANTIQVKDPFITGPKSWPHYEGNVSWNQTRVSGDTIKDESKKKSFTGSSRSDMEAELEAYRASKYEAAQFHSPYKVTVESNAAGLAVSSDPHAVEIARAGFQVEVGESTKANDAGALTVENVGDYDMLYFLDAKTGYWLGSADIGGGSVDNVRLDAPTPGDENGPGGVQIVIGNDVPDADMTIVPVASTVVDTDHLTPNDNGKIKFSSITVVDSLS